jgi:hypothetical protein
MEQEMLFPFPSRSRWNKAAEMANAAANPELLSEKIDDVIRSF